MAAKTGLNHTMIGRIWRTFGLKPHLTRTVKLSPDPQLIEKVRDVVGLTCTRHCRSLAGGCGTFHNADVQIGTGGRRLRRALARTRDTVPAASPIHPRRGSIREDCGERW